MRLCHIQFWVVKEQAALRSPPQSTEQILFAVKSLKPDITCYLTVL